MRNKLFLVAVSALSTNVINRMDPRKLDTYPHYLWVYALWAALVVIVFPPLFRYI